MLELLLFPLLVLGQTAPYRCDGNVLMNTADGEFKDSDPGVNYLNSRTCGWIVQPPPTDSESGSTTLVFRFEAFDLESGYDYLYVYDSANGTTPVLQLTGSLDTQPSAHAVVSKDGSFRFLFASDLAGTAGGFQLEYSVRTCGGLTPTGCGEHGYCFRNECVCEPNFDGASCNDAVCQPSTCMNGVCTDELNYCECNAGFFGHACDERVCGGVERDTRRSGNLADRSAGESYRPNSDCTWVIEPHPPLGADESLIITFTSFETEEEFDQVFVYDGDVTGDHAHAIGMLDGIPTTGLTYTAASGVMSLTFTSDYLFQKGGFSASWSTVSCGVAMCGGEERGHCTQGGCVCRHGYAGENCEEFECFDDCSGRGDCTAGGVCECSGGWSGLYCADCPSGTCDGYEVETCRDLENREDVSGFIEVHSGPGNAPANVACQWRLRPAGSVEDPDLPATTITLHFEMLDIGDPTASVVLRDMDANQRVIGIFGGTRLPTQSIHTVNPDVQIEFESQNVAGRGFRISYEGHSCGAGGCGNGWCYDGTCRCQLGYFGAQCENVGCSVETCDSVGSGSCALFKDDNFCQCAPGKFGPTCNIDFCGGTTAVSSIAGTVFDHFDRSINYISDLDCTFLLAPSSPSAGETVTVWFPFFDVEVEYDPVAVYSVPRSNLQGPTVRSLDGAKQLGVYSGLVHVPPMISRPDDAIVLKFESDFAFVYDGFEARYASSRLCPDGCSGSGMCLPQDHGLLRSSGQYQLWFDGTDPPPMRCYCYGGFSGESCTSIAPTRTLPIDGSTATAIVSPFSWAFFELELVDLVPEATIEVHGDLPEGSYALYRRGGLPSPDEFDLRSDDIATELRSAPAGTWYIGVYGGHEGGAVTLSYSKRCTHCFKGECASPDVSTCKCDDGWDGVTCDVRSSEQVYERFDCSTESDFRGVCAHFTATPCTLELSLETIASYTGTTDLTVSKTWTSVLDGQAVCQSVPRTDGLDNVLGPIDYCMELTQLEYNVDESFERSGTMSGCIRFLVSETFFGFSFVLHDETLLCFDEAVFVGSCADESGCLNGCSGGGDCVDIPGRDAKHCECRDGYRGAACEHEPVTEFTTCRDFPAASLGTAYTEVCSTLYLGCGEVRPNLSFQLTGDGISTVAATSSNPFDFDGAGLAVCTDSVDGECTYCVMAQPVSSIEDPAYTVTGCVELNITCDGESAPQNHLVGCYDHKVIDPLCHRDTSVCGDGVCTPGLEDARGCRKDCGCGLAPRPDLVGDGICDAQNNVDCCWDGGDCCAETCTTGSGELHQCGSQGYECVDPTGEVCVDPDLVSEGSGACPRGCENGGACGQTGCVCLLGFSGARCETEVADARNQLSCELVPRGNGARICRHVDGTSCPPELVLTYENEASIVLAEVRVPVGAGESRSDNCVSIDSDSDSTCALMCLGTTNVAVQLLPDDLISMAGCVTAFVGGCGVDLPNFYLGCFGSTAAVPSTTSVLSTCAAFDVCGDGVCGDSEDVTRCAVDCGCTAPGVDRATVGDGFCDLANNVPCCWDGGDCCVETCLPGSVGCKGGTEELPCISPTMACVPGDDCADGFVTADASQVCEQPVCDPPCEVGTCVIDRSGDHVCQCPGGVCGSTCSERFDRCLECGGDGSSCSGGTPTPTNGDPGQQQGGDNDDDDDDDDDGGAAGWAAFAVMLVLFIVAICCFFATRARRSSRGPSPINHAEVEMDSRSTQSFEEEDESVDTDIEEVQQARPSAVRHTGSSRSAGRQAGGVRRSRARAL